MHNSYLVKNCKHLDLTLHLTVHLTLTFEYCSGFCDFAAGLSVGFCGLAAGFAIGVVGDAGVRGLKLILFKNLAIYNVEYI